MLLWLVVFQPLRTLREHRVGGRVEPWNPGALPNADVTPGADEQECFRAAEPEARHEQVGQLLDCQLNRVLERGSTARRDPLLSGFDPGPSGSRTRDEVHPHRYLAGDLDASPGHLTVPHRRMHVADRQQCTRDVDREVDTRANRDGVDVDIAALRSRRSGVDDPVSWRG